MFDFGFALNTMLPLARAAYSLQQKDMPAGWTIERPITVDASIIGNVLGRMCPDEPIGTPFGLVARNGDQFAVSFRGTRSKVEWSDDFDFAPGQCEPWLPKLTVEHGFLTVYKALQKSSACTGDVIVTGHSLGAAIATLCAADLASQGIICRGVTWSGPRVGGRSFAKYFDSSITDWYRVVNTADQIPHLPWEMLGYEHVGTSVEVKGPSNIRDPWLVHGLDSCEAGLRALQQKAAHRFARNSCLAT